MEAFRVTEQNDRSATESGILQMSLTEWTMLDKTTLPKVCTKSPVFTVDDDKPVSEIIRPPNAVDGDVKALVDLVNGDESVGADSFFYGWLIDQGYIQVLHFSGSTQIVGPGRYWIPYWYKLFCSWGKRYSLTEDHISEGTFTMIRVQRGKLGLATENGRPVILAEGLHVYNSALFQFSNFKSVDEPYIKHMSYNLIRVPKGMFGKISEQNRPKMLPEGTHAVDNPVFSFDGLVNSKDQYINHATIHILQVPKGSLGLVRESNCPRLLHEGLHLFDSATLQFDGIQNKLEASILHGTISRFRIGKGEVGLAWHENEPLLMETPGTYQVDSSNFKFVKVVPATEKAIQLGARKAITVYSGEVGISYLAGKLCILQPQRHLIDAADHIFDDFLSTQQRSMRLKTSEADSRVATTEDLLICETKDLVSIGIRADVFFRIANPEQAILQVGREGIEPLVMETSIATLTNIMRSTALNEIAQSSNPSAVSAQSVEADAAAAQALGKPSAPLFFDKAHDQFLSKLHDQFMKSYGLEITNIRIEQFRIMDKKLADSISQQAVSTAATQNQIQNLQGQTEIATQEQERERRVAQIQAETAANQRRITAEADITQAEAEGRAQKVRAEAVANKVRITAEAEASATQIRAQATVAEAEAAAKGMIIRAEATVSEAKAIAEGIRLKAAAEADRATALSKTPLGEKLALLGIYSDVVKTSNAGVQKVVYVDPTSTSANNPFSLLALQSLNTDLASLQNLGNNGEDLGKTGKNSKK